MRTTVKFFYKPKVKNPILIEGLPGMGHVGKLAAEHLVSELNAKRFAELRSPHFPHHIYIEGGGLVRMVRNDFYGAHVAGKDLIILVGDSQAVTPEGHYEIAEKILEVAGKLEVKEIFTLGGYATGKYSNEKPKVVAVFSHPELMEKYKSFGIAVEVNGGPIIGASGLLLGLGRLRGMDGVCLLGETHGMIVDHKSAQSVLEVLTKILGFSVDMSALETRAKETEKLISRVKKEMELRAMEERRGAEEEAWYIG
ncbi:MAG: hypothetical protein APU95_03890 [Hadesarchaea archaeon YNP_N21]|jgi:uncharacterized protein (TIGR00162 family)|nr:MAG: hypothetical protein APU95_03890 [Hadesarchaea archaeon YNP_N21]